MTSKNTIKTSDISIIILLYNTPIKKIQNLLNYKDFNLLILDQSNDYTTKYKLNKLLPRISYYKVTKDNNGFAKGINFLTKKVKTKYFLCTQIDVLIKKRSIIELKNVFLRKKDCAISIPNFTYNKKLSTSSKNFLKVNRFIGAVFLTEKKKFNKIGKFDENFFFYWEDEDLSKRLEKLDNYNIYKCVNAYAKHISGSSTIATNKSRFIRLSNFKFGEYYFQNKFDKLKIIKVIREPLLLIIFIFFSIVTFQKSLFYKNLFTFIGIIKFFKHIILNKIY